jgi:hypothetical protein
MEVDGRQAIRLGKQDIYRITIKSEELDYIQTRIRLLS